MMLTGKPKTGCKSPAPSVSDLPLLMFKPTLRQVNHPEGQHYFQMRDSAWTCECGEKRDRNGKVIR